MDRKKLLIIISSNLKSHSRKLTRVNLLSRVIFRFVANFRFVDYLQRIIGSEITKYQKLI